MFFKKKKKEKLWKRLVGLKEETSYYNKAYEKMQKMSDEEFLLCYKKLFVKSYLISGLGIVLFCIGVLFIVIIF